MGSTLTNAQLNRALLARQMLLARETLSIPDAIARLVGLQAQLARPPFVGLWTRLQDFRRADLIKPLHERQVVRVTAMRGTLHLMTAGDYVALEELRPELVTFRDEPKRELFDLPDAPRPSEDEPTPIRFLPEFDNLVLSHDDRTRIMADEHRPRVTLKNLQVRATFLVDGFVAGTWKVERKKKTAALIVEPFAKLTKAAVKALEEEGDALLRFAEEDAEAREIRFAPV